MGIGIGDWGLGNGGQYSRIVPPGRILYVHRTFYEHKTYYVHRILHVHAILQWCPLYALLIVSRSESLNKVHE